MIIFSLMVCQRWVRGPREDIEKDLRWIFNPGEQSNTETEESEQER